MPLPANGTTAKPPEKKPESAAPEKPLAFQPAPRGSEIKLKRLTLSDIQTSRRSAVDDKALSAAKGILDAIEKDGEKALINIATKFGDLKPGEPYVLGRDKMEAAYKSLPTDTQELLQRAALRIRRFALAQLGTIKKSMSIGIEDMF